MAVNLSQLIVGPLRVGIRNDAVRLVQEHLNEVLAGTPGFARLGPDGAFGGKTEAAVIRFQKARQLRADGVVGPITAKALGFTQYTSLQRLGAGAMQLAGVITGSLARLLPSPHVEPDPTHGMLAALAVHASVMRRAFAMLGGIPGASGAMGEIDQIVAALEQKLATARLQAFVGSSRTMAEAYANSTQGRLLALSRQLQALARQQAPSAATASSFGAFMVEHAKLMALHAQAMRAMQALSGPPPPQVADELLGIAAKVVRTADRLLPKF